MALANWSNRNDTLDRLDTKPEVRGAAGSAIVVGSKPHKLDGPEAREELRMLLRWYYWERDIQAANRLEMAIDHDYYDGLQWMEDETAVLAEREQMPLVYNEIAPTCDWLIGTERRARPDWKVLPRTEDDVAVADVKTQVMKYLSDVNKTPFHRSRAFADAVKVGIGWVDDGTTDDPTKAPIYSMAEDWRRVLHDSAGRSPIPDDDARYIFRWRWIDEDIARMMWPDRVEVIERAIEEHGRYGGLADMLGNEVDLESDRAAGVQSTNEGGLAYPIVGTGRGAIDVNAKRRRLKVIECQYRKPVKSQFVTSGPMRGALFDPRDKALSYHLGIVGGSIVDRVAMRMHVACFTEGHLLSLGPSSYRHNRFSLTPIFAYRFGRTRLPYGTIRRVRGVQDDINKRASKASFLFNTNQLIGEEGAFDDWDAAAEEAQNPQGRIVHKQGYKVEIRRDSESAQGQLEMLQLGTTTIQKAAGVTDENLGHKTNAVSGEAIRARQLQGAVVTTELFDNLRLSVQTQGEKILSLAEQYLTDQAVYRITGAQGAAQWVRINQPEVLPDGSVRWVNDITASMADFIVAEQDYAGTLRQVMFDQLSAIAAKMPDPAAGVKFLRIAFQYSDLPNKDEIVDELRRLTGETDPGKQLTPEEQQQAAQVQQQQQEAMQLQRATAQLALQEAGARVREINARAEQLLAQADAARAGDGGAQQAQMQAEMRIAEAVSQVREASSREIDALTERLSKMTADRSVEIQRVRADSDSAVHVARIKADADRDVAETQAKSTRALDAMLAKITGLGKQLAEVTGKLTESQRRVEALEKADFESEAQERAQEKALKAVEAIAAKVEAAIQKPAAEPEEKAEPAPQQPQVVVVSPPAAPAAAAVEGAKLEYGPDGKLKAVSLKRSDGTEARVPVEGNKPPNKGME